MQIDEFLEHVKNHKMTVLYDDGAYKHLRFKQPDTNNRYFELMFYPNYSVITGDMGAWTFSRIEDMMAFHRGEGLDVDFRYWKEKVVSCSRFGAGNISAFSDFDFDEFSKQVMDTIDDYFEGSDIDESEIKELKQDVEDNVLSELSGYQNCRGADFKAYELLSNYSFEYGSFPCRTFEFYDIHDFSMGKMTGYFAFACYALRWGIQQYDEAQNG